jgi:retron-type reverse transcriptase
VRRWLAAPLALPDGTLQQRDRGTAQGSAVSPVLANLFLHYAFDAWMAREFPAVSFERYVDLCRARHKSAYAEDRIMPTPVSDTLVSRWFAVFRSA